MTCLRRHVFATYEQREEAFRRLAGPLIPRRYGGARLLWRDLREASGPGVADALKRPMARITANPRDGLAFGSARQVLAAALMTAGAWEGVRERIAILADQFRIAGNLGQPIRTLSGGETVKVALAKAAAEQPVVDRLIIASPFAWLSRDNRGCLDTLAETYARTKTPADILILDGEDSGRPAEAAALPAGPVFELRLAGVRTPLSPSFGVAGAPPATAAVADFAAKLRSPCLLVGANGQGKSLVAKILAGAVTFQGRAELRVEGQRAGARLLFQDVLTQTLLRDPGPAESPVATGFHPAVQALAASMAQEFESLCRQIAPESAAGRLPVLGRIKIALAASRLAAGCGALILDEPDWGLRRADAIAFVQAVVAAAHRRQTAVILISHKPWWKGCAGSTVTVNRCGAAPQGEERTLFTVGLRAEESA